MNNLTNKQKRFVAEYLVDMNATQAAIRAGYSPSSARHHACRMMAQDDIKQAVDEGMEKRAKRLELSQDEVVEDLRELRDICMKGREGNDDCKERPRRDGGTCRD